MGASVADQTRRIMKASLFSTPWLLVFLPLLAAAQPRPEPPPDNFLDFRPAPGTREITFGGSGGSNRHLNDSFGGLAASYGVFLTERWQLGLRQSVNYANPADRERTWNGSTRVAADYHFSTDGRILPFVGANFGRIYGSSLRDTWSAGLEAGGKVYVQSRTFVFVTGEYNWLFSRTQDLEDNFGSGQLYWSTGLGFNF